MAPSRAAEPTAPGERERLRGRLRAALGDRAALARHLLLGSIVADAPRTAGGPHRGLGPSALVAGASSASSVGAARPAGSDDVEP